MKTTLKYNTIETLQRKRGWKEYIDALVDSCKSLFDGKFMGVSGHDEFGRPIYSVVEDKPDEHIYNGNLAYSYPIMSYKGDNMPLNLVENASLRGLLRTLSLYGCNIAETEVEGSNLPHTFKIGGARASAVYGQYLEGGGDYEGRVSSDEYGLENSEIGYYVENGTTETGEVFYEEDIYGYNQKNPVLSRLPVREVREFYKYEKVSGADASLPTYVYVLTSQTTWSEQAPRPSVAADKLYKSEFDNGYDNGVVVADGLTIHDLTYYNAPDRTPVYRWIKDSGETSCIVCDREALTLIDSTGRVQYNGSEAQQTYPKVWFTVSDKDHVCVLSFTRVRHLEGRATIDASQDVTVQRSYYVYKDSSSGREWIVLDSVGDMLQCNPMYSLSQIYGDESTLSVQPLFFYNSGRMVSLCANVIGGGNLNYEITAYSVNSVQGGSDTIESVAVADGVTCGDSYYKWNMYTKHGSGEGYTLSYDGDVYTPIVFTKDFPYCKVIPKPSDNPQQLGWYELVGGEYELTEDTTPSSIKAYYKKYGAGIMFFFDGNGGFYYFGNAEADSEQIEVGDLVFKNSHTTERFETMYFNHFAKVQPIDAVAEGGAVKTKKLYCEQLDLVRWGNITPYIASFDKAADTELDSTVFSKIVAYNKNTHLITVDKDVYFQNANSYKYVVVAYKNASPFSKIKTLRITAPSDEIKDTVKGLLESFVNQNCALEIKTEGAAVYDKIN